ncbi:MAG: glycosyltransferase [Bacteroidetes bacterium]|nr:MAG: glycosyltransferase [Bacteroidota bacterium]
MKILLLCKKFPYPLKDGESIAIHTLSKSLQALGCEISLLAMNTSKHFFAGDQHHPELAHYHRIETIAVDNRLKPWSAFRNLFSEHSYHIERFVSKEFGDILARMLQQEAYDVIQLETLYLAPYIPIIRTHSKALVSMRAHNVEHEIWDRITHNTPFGIKRWYLQHLTTKLRRFERQALQLYDMLLPITERDLRYFRQLGATAPARVIPIGIPTSTFSAAARPAPNKQTIAFIGSLDWRPNLEGLEWFIRQVWPLVLRRFPNMELHIAGRNTPQSLFQLANKSIKVHGEVPDSTTFINQYAMMVVPLLSGSGMRAKILEGMALAKVILTTSIGLEGISAADRKEVLIANRPVQFVDSLELVLGQEGRLSQIGHAARDFVFQYYDSEVIARRLLEAYSQQLVGILD